MGQIDVWYDGVKEMRGSKVSLVALDVKIVYMVDGAGRFRKKRGGCVLETGFTLVYIYMEL